MVGAAACGAEILTNNMQRLLVGLLGENRRVDGHLAVVRAGRLKVQVLERDDALVGVLQLSTG